MGNCCCQEPSATVAGAEPRLPLISWRDLTSSSVTQGIDGSRQETESATASALDELPVELLAKVLGYMNELDELQPNRLICRKWYCAVTCLLEDTLSALIRRGSMQLMRLGPRTMRRKALARQIVCALPGMSPGVLDSVTEIKLGGPKSVVTDQVLFLVVSFFAERNEPLAAAESAGLTKEQIGEGVAFPEACPVPEPTPYPPASSTMASGLESMRTLWLHGCENITDEAAAHIVKLKTLQSLDVFRCVKLTDQSLSAWAAGLPTLTSLTVADCSQITDAGLRALSTHKSNAAGSASKLQFLDLSYCKLISDEGVGSLVALRNLQSLNLRWCRLITDKGVGFLAGLPCLSHLNLSFCSEITDASIVALCRGGENAVLRNLNLHGCEKLTDACVAALMNLAELKIVILLGCPNISPESVQRLESTPGLRARFSSH